MSEKQQEIRNVQLLEDEDQWLALHGRYGLVEEVPPRGDCVVLTSQRLIGFWQEESRHRQVLLPIQNVEAVEITDMARNLKPLVQGGLLLLGAVAVVWLAAAFNVVGILPWLIAGVLVLLAAVTASTYFVAEETAMINFRARISEVALPLRSSEALRDAYSLANGFFQAKAGQIPTAVQDRVSPQASPWEEAGEPGQGEGATSTPDTASNPLESAQAESCAASRRPYAGYDSTLSRVSPGRVSRAASRRPHAEYDSILSRVSPGRVSRAASHRPYAGCDSTPSGVSPG